MNMNMRETIERRLGEALQPNILEVTDESHAHSVPEGAQSHFRVVVVAECFAGKTLVARHRMVNAALAEELSGRIHALALHTHTPAEWSERGERARRSPPCMGGAKHG